MRTFSVNLYCISANRIRARYPPDSLPQSKDSADYLKRAVHIVDAFILMLPLPDKQ